MPAELSPELVSGALEYVENTVREYVCLPSEADYAAVALWVIATHMSRHHAVYSRLIITAASKVCGKSRLGELVAILSSKGKVQSSPTAPVLFRQMNNGWRGENSSPPTLFFDEMHNIWKSAKKGSETAMAIVDIVKEGSSRLGTVPRCSQADQFGVIEYRVGGYLILACVGSMPDEVESRGIVIRMRKIGPNDAPVSQWKARHHSKVRVVRDALDKLFRDAPELPEIDESSIPARDRDADIWEPLIQIADYAGGDWPKRAREACQLKVRAFHDDDNDKNFRFQLLCGISQMFAVHAGRKVVKGSDLVEYLSSDTDAPWYRDDYTTTFLRQVLQEFEIKAGTHRPGGGCGPVHGYQRDDFIDAWQRYGLLSGDADDFKEAA